MNTIFTKGFQGKQIVTPQGQQIRMQQPAQPTFGGAPPAAPAPAPARGAALPTAAPAGLPGRQPVPVIKKGSGGPSCPVCRG